MGQRLKDEVAVLGAIAQTPQGGQSQRVRGVVGQIKAALRRERHVDGIGEARLSGAQQSLELRH
jgi:hypothetical protein